MPVIDHPIHPSTQKGEDFRYGCWNRKQFADGYLGSPWGTAEWVDHTMSTDCKYDLSHKDNNCKGCKYVPQPEAAGDSEEVTMSELREAGRNRMCGSFESGS